MDKRFGRHCVFAVEIVAMCVMVYNRIEERNGIDDMSIASTTEMPTGAAYAADRTAETSRPMPTVLKGGNHLTPEEGMCLTEAVAWIAGEPHSDRPECCCPVLTAFGRTWNDALGSDANRERLLKFVPRLVGTRADTATEQRRSGIALDWLIRDYLPVWFDLAGLNAHATALRDMSVINQSILEAARDAARSAVGRAPWESIHSITGEAACDAVRVVARGDDATIAALATAGDAVWVSAWAAATVAENDVIDATVAALHDAAEELFERMIAA